MNKIKNLVPVVILMVLSITVVTICNDYTENENIINSSSSQVENSQILDNADETELNDINFENTESYNSSKKISDIIDDSIEYENNENDPIDTESGDYKFIQISGKLSRANTSPEKAFTYTGGNFTVSLLRNDIQLLKTDDIVANPDLITQYNDIVTREKNTCCKGIKAVDYYTKDSTGYDYLNDNDILFTNHTYDPVVTKITYVDYDDDERIPKEEWYQVFKQILINENKQAENTPVIFRESWSFNDNGNIIEIVTANNIVSKEENEITKFTENSDCYLEPVIPKYNELFAYKITVIFINGETSYISKIISKIDKSHFNYPTDDKYIFTDKYKCYQYIEDGSVCACPLFMQGDSNLRNLICWDTYMYLDIDNDNYGELIELSDSWSTSWLPGVATYEIDNGKLINSLIGI